MRLRSTLATMFALVMTGTAFAQPNPIGSLQRPNLPNQHPTVSPYLNLFGGSGGNPAINYYGIVRPQVETQQSLQHLQQGLQNLPQMMGGAGQGQDGTNNQFTTGHGVAFLNYSHYFPLYRGNTGGNGLGRQMPFGASMPIFSPNGFNGFGNTPVIQNQNQIQMFQVNQSLPQTQTK